MLIHLLMIRSEGVFYKSEYAPGQNKEKSNNGNGKAEKKNPLKLKTDTTSYLYDGFTNDITNEYTGNGSPLSQYYMANDRVVSKKTFGNHGLVIPGREPSLKTNGGLMDYHYDGMRNVTELTDRHGDSIEQYRYDSFGGLFTGITAPYNTNSFAGKSYDPKANLIDNQARWYQAQTGRFTSADPYRGELLTPDTQNRYAYVGNNPINRWDPLGYWQIGDGDLSAAAKAAIGKLETKYYSIPIEEVQKRLDVYGEANEIRREDRHRWTEKDDDRKIGSWEGTPKIDRNDPVKVSDGWNTSWTRIDYYNEKYEIVERKYSEYEGLLNTTVSYRTDTTATTTRGVDFRPFTASEWYQENKALLEKYDIPISQANTEYNPRDAYSKTLSTTRKTTSVEKIVSRIDNNQYKDGIIAQGISDSGQGTGNDGVTQQTTGQKIADVAGKIFQNMDDYGNAIMMNDPIPNGSLGPASLLDNAGGLVLSTLGKGGKFVANILTKGDDVVKVGDDILKVVGKTTLEYLDDVQKINGSFYAPKNVIDEIGKIQAKGVDFSDLTRSTVSSRTSTEGGFANVFKYTDDKGTKFIVHEVTDATGKLLHRDFDAVRIESGQLINKLQK